MGYTRDITVGVWAGNFENQPMKGISGVDGAASIFRRTMLLVHDQRDPAWFEEIDAWTTVRVDPRNGKLVNDPEIKTRAVRIPMTMIPEPAGHHDYGTDGKALLDETFGAWFHGPHNYRRGDFSLRESLYRIAPLRILAPNDGSLFLLDPEIPGGGSRLRPITEPADAVEWSCDTLIINGSRSNPVISLTPGTHRLEHFRFN